VFIDVLIVLNVVDEFEDGVTRSLTFPDEISLSKVAKIPLVLIMAYSVL
jgi:hypothetical protein